MRQIPDYYQRIHLLDFIPNVKSASNPIRKPSSSSSRSFFKGGAHHDSVLGGLTFSRGLSILL
ncbi:hypothetical protein JXJ21_26670 [candidate division KSB1 bacterium]|nr:hypothetical protein [candidate division KSB1 bacterium]